ncbi:MBL fold metallo-hydrolase [Actinomadura sp. LOL_016]|uniref:MBL fold metallo-hydrolase n=1 Tax=unclassified Actinomadura TaxID=2626254 RepID=UPI003A80050A
MVNVALFETAEGLLLVDCGCAGDGPALLEAVRSVSDAPLHTVVHTHGHSDHAFGLWAFLEAGGRPRVVAHENVPAHFRRYMKTAGLNARINGQLPCRNVVRRDGGWWNGHPADLLPAPQAARAAEVARLAGGTAALAARARELRDTDLRLACHLAEWAFLADRSDPVAQECYLDVFEHRASAEPSLMAQVNFRVSRRWVAEAREAANGEEAR